MAALGPRAQSLVRAGRAALRPADGDRDRIEAALRAELGPAALPPPGSVAPPPVVAVASWKAALGAALGAGAIAVALYLARSPAKNSPQVVPVTASATTSPPAPPAEPPGETAAAVAEAPPSVVVPPVTAPPSASASPPRDRLAEEVALLSRATKALRAGRAGEALGALDEHQSRFPRGLLSEERRAAKAEALCSLGRTSEGRAELARLAPQSPAAARAKQACDRISGEVAPSSGSSRK
ncbi:MAG TPA: hypothetical protein VHE30_27285 [Polyangiaceae bacterium]|nr:hypothetical protein [Polyangiaceae bacterium]